MYNIYNLQFLSSVFQQQSYMNSSLLSARFLNNSLPHREIFVEASRKRRAETPRPKKNMRWNSKLLGETRDQRQGDQGEKKHTAHLGSRTVF